MRTTINNWTEACSVEVVFGEAFENIPALVGIQTSYGPLRMQFDMTAEQAREMAAALLTYADKVEVCQPVVAQ